MTIINEPNDIEMFRLITIRRVLQLEVETGIQVKGGNLVLRRAKEALALYDIKPKRNKKDVLVQMNELLSPLDQ